METDTFARPWCDECDTEAEAVVDLGAPIDSPDRTASICLPCLEKAVTLLREALNEESPK